MNNSRERYKKGKSMDYQYAPPPPPKRFHICRCHHINDQYYPYSRDFVEKKAKIGLLAGISATSLFASIVAKGTFLGGTVLPVLGAAGLVTASVMAIKAAIQRKTNPEMVVVDNAQGIGMHR